jgi:ubiquinone/menaquinone biosynthesis C-methylase UbiE
MKSRSIGLPKESDTNHAYRMYEGIEYKEFWKESKKHNLDRLEHAIVSSLLPACGRRIIDIGCGFGRLSDCYLDRFEQVIMLDGSVTLLQQARKTVGEGATYVAADANNLPLRPSSMDCVLLFRVFHHLPDSHSILTEVRRVLGRKGVFVFNYCNKISLRQLVLWMLRRKRENPLTLETIGIGTRLISHHPRYIRGLLEKNGYSNMKYLGAGIFDKIPDPFGILFPLAKLLAPVFGLTNLAPWINCRAITSSGEPLDTMRKVEDIFICPSCHCDLVYLTQAYVCKSCEHIYPIEDGIIDFRLASDELF